MRRGDVTENGLREALIEARREMRARYDDLRWCNKLDDCQTKASGADLAIGDFDDVMRRFGIDLDAASQDSPATGEGLREALTDLRADVLALGRSEHGFISRYRVLEMFDNALASLAATTLDPGEAE